MAEWDDVASDGSDFELGDEEELDEIEQIELYDEDAHLAAQIFAESDTEEEEFAGFLGGWSANPRTFQPRQTRAYRREQGVNVPLPLEAKASDFFFLFWDDVMWQKLVDETNRYRAQQVGRNGVAPRAPTWRPVTVAEMNE